ncbi:MAG: hypothetical protein ACREAI_03065, partial [Nitrososphaera sp.]
MSQPARKKALTAAVVSAAILAALFVPFQKAGGNSYESVFTQLAFTAAEAPAGPAAMMAAAVGLTVDAVDLSGNPV